MSKSAGQESIDQRARPRDLYWTRTNTSSTRPQIHVILLISQIS